MTALGGWVLLDYLGVAVFAATGALAAARGRHDIIAFVFFAAITGVGGGTLRDVVLDLPVFWVGDQGYLLVCAAVAGLVWIAGPVGPVREKLLLWADAVGLSAYAVLGAHKALEAGAPVVVATVMGVFTAVFGGIVRDLVAGQPTILLRREIYVTSALVAAGVFVLLTELDLATLVAALIAFAAGFGLRAGALLFGWTLPGWGQGGEEPRLDR